MSDNYQSSTSVKYYEGLSSDDVPAQHHAVGSSSSFTAASDLNQTKVLSNSLPTSPQYLPSYENNDDDVVVSDKRVLGDSSEGSNSVDSGDEMKSNKGDEENTEEEQTALFPKHGPKNKKKAFVEKFIPRGNAGVVSTFVNIVKANIGTGILGMPFAFMNSGLYLGLVSIILLLVVCIYCTLLLIKTKQEINFREAKVGVREKDKFTKTYCDVGKYAFGQTGSVLIHLLLFFTQGGFCCAYLIFIGENVQSIISSVNVWMTVLCCGVILFPITSLLFCFLLKNTLFTNTCLFE